MADPESSDNGQPVNIMSKMFATSISFCHSEAKIILLKWNCLYRKLVFMSVSTHLLIQIWFSQMCWRIVHVTYTGFNWLYMNSMDAKAVYMVKCSFFHLTLSLECLDEKCCLHVHYCYKCHKWFTTVPVNGWS